MAFDAALLGRLPVLVRPGLDPAAEAALGRAVLLASVPGSVRDAVPDAALARFLGRRRSTAAPGDPWSAMPAGPDTALPERPDPRQRAILAAAPAMAAPAAAPPLAATADAPPAAIDARLLRARSAKAALGAAESLLRARAEAGSLAWRGPADALDQARAAAGRLVRALEEAHADRRVMASAAPELAAADAHLARWQDAAGAPDRVDEAAEALAAARAALAGLAGAAPEPLTQAIAAPILRQGAARSRRAVPPRAPPEPRLAPSPRRVPSLPPAPPQETAAIGPRGRPATPAQGWGSRAPAPADPPAMPGAVDEGEPQPFDPATAGMLAGIAAAARLMRGQGLGSAGDPRAIDRLATTIAAFEAEAARAPAIAEEDLDRLVRWGGLARQAGTLRERLGVVPWESDGASALADGLRRRARWLAERPAWLERQDAAAALMQWLPLVDCAEALGLSTQGEGALRTLGRAVRHLAAAPLPGPSDPVRTARHLAALDAMASLREALGIDPTDPRAEEAMARMARGLSTLPPVPEADTAGALDRSALDRLRRLDRTQAGELGLDGLGRSEIPLLSRGLPVLATLDAAARLGIRPGSVPSAAASAARSILPS